MKTKVKSTKIILALAAGALAGAAVGLLFAPEDGKGLRKKMKTGFQDMLDEVTSLASKGKNTLSKVRDVAIERVNDTQNDTQEEG